MLGIVAQLTCLIVTLGSDPAQEELARHQGTWAVTAFVRDGEETPKEIATSIIRIVDGDHVTWKREGKSFAGTSLILDPSTDPRSLDVIPDGGPWKDQRVLGIYKREGEILTICMAAPTMPRPRAFTARSGSGWTLMTFRREPVKP